MQWWQKAGLCLFQEFLQNVALSFWDLYAIRDPANSVSNGKYGWRLH